MEEEFDLKMRLKRIEDILQSLVATVELIRSEVTWSADDEDYEPDEDFEEGREYLKRKLR